jgi:predicted nucleotidyltransferase
MIVFGSRARGDSVSDSDMDVFIEIPALDANLRRQISEIAWEISLEEGVVISTFVATTRAITTSPLQANPILRTIDLEGIQV